MYLAVADAVITKIPYKNTILSEDKSLKKPLGLNEKSTANPLSTEDTNDSTTELASEESFESSTDSKLSLTTAEEERILKSTTLPTKMSVKLPKKSRLSSNRLTNSTELVPCTCGIFLNSQFTKGSTDPPRGEAVISNLLDRTFPCNGIGQRQCQTKCLEQIARHLPNSANILCAALDHDIHKQRAYLFTKNCQDVWVNTNLAAGREYCCKNREPYSCKK
ncbi:follicle cell protein 3C-1-like [Musca domestica]|uniref:Follicle cell protein 3C-1-like n=1 Tax=Musca domestica TaxID=7370 RepID=A0ABM3UW62_MUSDO|nr:follicle cell protein 3C-1-like [Musca domestica]